MDCVIIDKEQFVEVFGRETEKHASYYSFGGVVFSAVKRGGAVVTHVGCKQENMTNLREACKRYCYYMLNTFEWCKMVIATVDLKRQSVINLCRKLGFTDAGDFEFEYGTAKVMVKTK
jgi:putative IMPACT (imprinted ancient) family translation regulator